MQNRVKFNFEIYFTNGGNIKGEDFRLDIDGGDISDKELADYLVEDMRLLMVGETKILNKLVFNEKHKRKPIITNSGRPRFIDLSHVIESGMNTMAGFPPPTISKFLTREDSRKLYAPGTEFQIDRIDLISSTGTYLDSPFSSL